MSTVVLPEPAGACTMNDWPDVERALACRRIGCFEARSCVLSALRIDGRELDAPAERGQMAVAAHVRLPAAPARWPAR